MPDALTQMLHQLPSGFRDNGNLALSGKIQTGLGAGFLGLGILIGTIGTIVGEPGMWAGALGPTLAGIINLGFGIGARRMARSQPPIEMSEDARSLVTSLYIEKVGIPLRHRGPRSRLMANVRPAVVLPEPVERLLHRFAEAYLALKESAQNRDANVSRHGVRAKLAADEAAAEAFNLAAQSVRHPGQGHEAELEKLIASVEEAAQRLDPRESSPGALGSLLTDLREEERARQELGG